MKLTCFQIVSFPALADQNKAELARFSKNFLPILFNLFSTETDRGERDGMRQAVLETVRCYFQITPAPLIDSFFNMCLGKFQEEGMSVFRRYVFFANANNKIMKLYQEVIYEYYHFLR